ncbi:hypothetical protein ACIBG8_07325 [Nonomuraea sp. NPDC050556]|uniref:hypothetical protein n=1 Tax=Nonomuraea sp. NPDC050556 TaxID=3364369 RepID=UPI003788042F
MSRTTVPSIAIACDTNGCPVAFVRVNDTSIERCRAEAARRGWIHCALGGDHCPHHTYKPKRTLLDRITGR